MFQRRPKIIQTNDKRMVRVREDDCLTLLKLVSFKLVIKLATYKPKLTKSRIFSYYYA